jgi:subtilisin family serine protease
MWRRIAVLMVVLLAVGLCAWPRSGRLDDGSETRQRGPAGGCAAAASPRAGAAITPPDALVQPEEAVLPAVVLDRPEGPLAVQLVRRAGGRREPIRIEDQQGRRREMAGDHLLITPRAGIDRAQLAAAVARTGAHLRRQVGRTRSWLAAFPVASHEDLPRQRLALAAQPEIAAVEDDTVVRALCTPDDPRFGEQWSLLNTGQGGGTVGADIEADNAWSITTGDARVLVGVLDSGVDFSHPDLAPNRWTNPGETGLDALDRDKRSNGVDDDGNGFIDDWHGWDFVADDNDPADENGHGTHCAGVIGARGGDHAGVAGVAWRTSLVAVRFLDARGNGLTSDAVAAIDYATRIGCQVTANSWGYPAGSAALRDAILANAAPFVVAAGNSPYNLDTMPVFPAAFDCPSIIAVTSTTRTDTLSTLAGYGAASVDLGAPGEAVLSCALGGGWEVRSGTSIAAAHAAGVLALMRAADPARDTAGLKAALLANTDPIVALTGRCVSGGRLNAARAVRAVAGKALQIGNQVLVEVGDGDGVFEPSETVTITVYAYSAGSLPIPGVVGTLVLDSPEDVVETASATWDDLPLGEARGNATPLRVRLGASTSPRLVTGTLTLAESGGRTWLCPVSIPVAPAGLLRVRVQDVGGSATVSATVNWDGLATGSAFTAFQPLPGQPNLLRQLPSGTYQVSASAYGCAPAGPVTVTVPVLGPTPVLTLTRPRMVASPLTLGLLAPGGGSASANLRIDNPGDGPLDVTATVVGQPPWTATGLWHRSTPPHRQRRPGLVVRTRGGRQLRRRHRQRHPDLGTVHAGFAFPHVLHLAVGGCGCRPRPSAGGGQRRWRPHLDHAHHPVRDHHRLGVEFGIPDRFPAEPDGTGALHRPGP